ncbi:Achain a, uridine phosphorylase, partial [Globisporangium splendens]
MHPPSGRAPSSPGRDSDAVVPQFSFNHLERRAQEQDRTAMLYQNTNAMPKHADGTVLHLGVKAGEVANRIVSVGSLDRARLLAALLDNGAFATYESSRGFTTFTGEIHGVPVSIIATGMVRNRLRNAQVVMHNADPYVVCFYKGTSNMDFVVRETRAIVEGPMAVIRFGTCGGLKEEVVPGSVVVSGTGSVSIVRDPDAFFDEQEEEKCYRVSRIMPASAPLSTSLLKIMEGQLQELQAIPAVAASADRHKLGVYNGLNATACSFYSSQGRINSAFDDRNEKAAENLIAKYPDLHTLEMETFHLLDLAQRSRGSIVATAAVLVVANRKTAQVVAADVLEAVEAFWGRAILTCLAQHELNKKATGNMSDNGDGGKRWFPLESNPAVMNTYVQQMGFPTAEFSFCDVLSTEDWALEMVPTPVLGVIMLFPIKPHTEAFAKEEEGKILRDGQVVSDSVYYMHQTVGNACGTIGILHAIGNMRQHITLDPSSYLGKLFNKTETKTPDEIAEFLENDNELEETHSSAADAGQSEQLESVDDPINTHFICFSIQVYRVLTKVHDDDNAGHDDTVCRNCMAVAHRRTRSDTANDGSFAKPFQTLARAKQEVQVQKQKPANANAPVNMFLCAGRYALAETLEFGADDSGLSAQAPVTYQAYCDPAVENAATSVLGFPYRSHLATPPRLLWNGVGDKTTRTGPVDPFLQMGINVTSNSLLKQPIAPPQVENMDIGDVCVDKNGVGHTCYASPLASCVIGCMRACALQLERKTYSETFHNKFTHLFGKDLRKEEDCVEVCTLSCKECEKVTLSGSTLIPASSISTWTLSRALTVGSGVTQQTLKIFQADLTPFLPAPVSPDTQFSFSTLYVDNVPYPRAGFPNCFAISDPVASPLRGLFNCSYAPASKVENPDKVFFDPATFSSKASQWTNPQSMVLEVHPNSSEAANLFYSVESVKIIGNEGQIRAGAGGTELSFETFEHELASTATSQTSASFRVENVFQELDSPGEWFFDATTKCLYVIPLDSASATPATMAAMALEIPVLRQLVRVSGSRDNQFIQAAHASSSLLETDSRTKASHLQFRHLVFSGT